MKRVINTFAVVVLCLCMLVTSVPMTAFAADVGKSGNIVIASVGSNSIGVRWRAVSGIDGYEVYRRQSIKNEWESIGTAKERTYTDNDVDPGEIYYYAVRCYVVKKNALGLKIDTARNRTYGDMSKSVKTASKPNKVSGLKATSDDIGSTTIDLAWNTSKGAQSYQVWKLNDKTGEYERIAVTTKTKYTVKKLSPTTKYSFKVRAYHKKKGIVYADYSAVVSVTTKPADVKNFKLAKSATTSYTLTWSAVKGIDGYQLAKYDKDAKGWKVILNDTTETSYEVKNIVGSQSDRYKIRGYIKNGSSKLYGNWTEEIVGGTIPSAPKNLQIAPNTDNGVALTWDYTENAAGYEVYCRDESGNWKSVGTTMSNHFAHSNLTEKKKYEYKIRAYIGTESSKINGNFGEVVAITYTPIEIPETFYPEDWDSTGILGYLYDPNERCFYTADDPWQRNFGYSELYDLGANFVAIIIETVRLKFSYDDRDWMFQLWKGNYGFVLYGAEIGIYTKPKSRPIEHYDCATNDDMIQMEMTLYEKSSGILGLETWVKSFSRPYERQWWHTGFVWGNMMTRFDDDLKLWARLTMRDYAMLSAVEEAFDKNDFERSSIKDLRLLVQTHKNCYSTNGLDIQFLWV